MLGQIGEVAEKRTNGLMRPSPMVVFPCPVGRSIGLNKEQDLKTTL
jgi:hypothetical protein